MSSNQNSYSITQWVLRRHELPAQGAWQEGHGEPAGGECPWERAGRALSPFPRVLPPCGGSRGRSHLLEQPKLRQASHSTFWKTATSHGEVSPGRMTMGCKLRACNGDPAAPSPLREKEQQGLPASLPGAGPSTGMILLHPHNQEGWDVIPTVQMGKPGLKEVSTDTVSQ